MKRDMDLVREILLYLEEHASPDQPLQGVQIGERSEHEITEHVHLLVEAGLIEAENADTMDGECWLPQRLTWAGHEFLDAARDAGRWARARDTIKKSGGTLSFDLVKALLIAFAKEKLKAEGLLS